MGNPDELFCLKGLCYYSRNNAATQKEHHHSHEVREIDMGPVFGGHQSLSNFGIDTSPLTRATALSGDYFLL